MAKENIPCFVVPKSFTIGSPVGERPDHFLNVKFVEGQASLYNSRNPAHEAFKIQKSKFRDSVDADVKTRFNLPPIEELGQLNDELSLVEQVDLSRSEQIFQYLRRWTIRHHSKIKIMTFKNAISWFEIPATDLARAQQFYETIFDMKMVPLDTPNLQMRMFPLENMMTGVGGALSKAAGFYKPSATEGPLVYLNGNPDLQKILDKIESAGGKIVVPKTQISPEYGYMAVFIDTEGNRVALHSVP